MPANDPLRPRHAGVLHSDDNSVGITSRSHVPIAAHPREPSPCVPRTPSVITYGRSHENRRDRIRRGRPSREARNRSRRNPGARRLPLHAPVTRGRSRSGTARRTLGTGVPAGRLHQRIATARRGRCTVRRWVRAHGRQTPAVHRAPRATATTTEPAATQGQAQGYPEREVKQTRPPGTSPPKVSPGVTPPHAIATQNHATKSRRMTPPGAAESRHNGSEHLL